MKTSNSTPTTFALETYQSLKNDELTARIQTIRRKSGSRLVILGHHYQQDEVIAMADLRGDSLRLSALAAENQECRAIAFCGVHFMAETADILANRPERLAERNGQRVDVLLPDLAAGCSMADMADIDQVEECWEQLSEMIDTDQVMPVTYINSAASLKAFCGRKGGTVCTSSNADLILKWALDKRRRVLFFPDQHLGRNTALSMGIGLEEMPLWDPYAEQLGGNTKQAIQNSRVLLWKGDCSVHQVFKTSDIDQFRNMIPDIKIMVHPECCMEVAAEADEVGSTGQIIKAIEKAAPGTCWAIGTELHLVERLKNEHPEQEIHFLSSIVCMCATMFRIDLPHLCWTLENWDAGTPVNIIRVDDETARGSLLALERMLELS